MRLVSFLCGTLLLHAQPVLPKAAIDEAALRILSDTGVPAASIAIVRDGKIEYAQAYGLARLKPALKATPDMRFKIGSNSKQFIATAILMLAEEGKLSLNDPVSKFIPGTTRGNEITLRHLLTHTSGYQDYYPLDYVAPFMTQAATPMSIVDRWAKKKLDFEPGSQYQYSNTNYTLAGMIIEKLSGQPVFEFLKTRMLTPLHMNTAIDADSAASWSASDPQGYTRHALGSVVPVAPEANGWLYSAGPLAMSASDLARWDIGLMNAQLLKPASYEAMTTPPKLTSGEDSHYALGLGIGKTPAGHRRWSHGGGTAGFISQNTIFPDDRISITVLTNGESGAASRLHREIERMLFAPAASEADHKALSSAKQIFTSLQAGHVESALISSDLAAYFTPQVVKEFQRSLHRLGPPTSFVETSSGLRGGMNYRSFRITTATRSLMLSTFLEPDGRFAQFLITPGGE